jgi:AcrR family transcriptional regulator
MSKTREPLTRDVIVSQTLNLLDDQGVAGFRLKELAGRLNVTIPNLYRHFKNREDIIYSALADDYIAMCHDTVRNVQRLSHHVASLPDFLSALGESVLARNPLEKARRRATRLQALASIGEHERSDEMRRALHSVHEAVEDFFRQAQAVGTLRSDFSPGALAWVTRSIHAGVVVGDLDPDLNISETEFWNVLAFLVQALSPSDVAGR